MIGITPLQGNIFFLPLAEQISSTGHPVLDQIEDVCSDPELVELVWERLASRHQNSERTGRPGMSPDQLLRVCILKHLMDLSFRRLAFELRSNLVYRVFTHYYEEQTPDYSSLCRNLALLRPEDVKKISDRIVQKSVQLGVTRGVKMRTDTTVVETNIHHPSDSSLLGDGIRVLTRILKRVHETVVTGVVSVTDHSRAAKRRIIEISRAAKSFSKASNERMRESYKQLLALTSDVVRRAEETLEGLTSGSILVAGDDILYVEAQKQELSHFLPLVKKVIFQTKARIFGEDNHVEGKILSLFETHTVPIRKGKPHKKNEFGRLARFDEVEGGIVSNYEVSVGNPADTNGVIPAVDGHIDLFGRAPGTLATDRGFFSAANERYAEEKGVERVALPGRGPLSKSRAARQKERWFQRAMKWRSGIEARISTLKNVFGLACSVYKGDEGIKRHVGWAVIANNLSSIARCLRRRKS